MVIGVGEDRRLRVHDAILAVLNHPRRARERRWPEVERHKPIALLGGVPVNCECDDRLPRLGVVTVAADDLPRTVEVHVGGTAVLEEGASARRLETQTLVETLAVFIVNPN